MNSGQIKLISELNLRKTKKKKNIVTATQYTSPILSDHMLRKRETESRLLKM